jgi:hypothetical protein
MSSQGPSADIPEVIPVPEKKRRPCPRCGSEDILRRLPLMVNVGEHGNRACGLAVHTNQRGLLGGEIIGIVPLHLNLCRQCGTVMRIYMDHPDEDWYVPPESSPLA